MPKAASVSLGGLQRRWMKRLKLPPIHLQITLQAEAEVRGGMGIDRVLTASERTRRPRQLDGADS